MVSGETETEVKIRILDANSLTDKLSALGFVVSSPRSFESNTVYDTVDHRLKNNQMLLRLRDFAGRGVLTWKGPGIPGVHKTRPELETSVDSIRTLGQVFQNLGFEPVFRYEKYRTEFASAADPRGTVTLDETPIGNFAELEGPGEWIDEWSRRLGFSRQDYILDSYGTLYKQYCLEHGVQPSHMVFAS